jgi:hypothetical protein
MQASRMPLYKLYNHNLYQKKQRQKEKGEFIGGIIVILSGLSLITAVILRVIQLANN